MTTRTLLVLRHAKSSWETDDADIDRPLAGRGKRDGIAAGRMLSDYRIDVALVSAAARAQQTWQQAERGGAKAGTVIVTRNLYLAWPAEILEELHGLGDQVRTALVIGHEPTVSELVTTLARPSAEVERVAAHFPTSALAVLRFEGPWDGLAPQTAELVGFEIPRGCRPRR